MDLLRVEILVKDYLESPDPETLEQIVEGLRPYVESLANRMATSPSLDRNDLIQEGNIEVIRALSVYDVTKGTKFRTFAYSRIRGAMQHYIRDQHHVIRQPAKVQEIRHKLRHKELPNTESAKTTLAREMNISLVTLESACEEVPQLCDITSITRDWAPVAPMSAAHDPTNSIMDMLELELLIAQLTEREQKVLRMHIDGFSNQEIGVELGLAPKYAATVVSRALAALRALWYNNNEDSDDVSIR